MNNKKVIIGIGEVLWDLLPDGKVLGGAPINFAYHASQLGAVGVAVSAVGNDPLGQEILETANQKGITNCIETNAYPTGTVGVTLNNGKPDYTIYENVAWDHIELLPKAASLIQKADAICFGTLAQRSPVSHQTILSALEMAPKESLKIYDINLRQHFYSKELIHESLKHANIFKINDEEIELLSKMFLLKGSETEVCMQLMDDYSLNYLALTKGEEGSYLFGPDEISFQPTPKVVVADTVGAGDSFTAAMVVGILNHWPLHQIHQNAVELSAFVCTRKGATPVLTEEFLTYNLKVV